MAVSSVQQAERSGMSAVSCGGYPGSPRRRAGAEHAPAVGEASRHVSVVLVTHQKYTMRYELCDVDIASCADVVCGGIIGEGYSEATALVACY